MPKSFEYTGRDLESMSGAENYHRHILRTFAPYLGSHVVEVGAGDGTVTRLIAELGPRRITAIEPAATMFRRLQRGTADLDGVTPRQGFLADFAGPLAKQRPSSFVYINVFEHIEDDLAEMQRVWKILPPGGHLCIFVPALPALYSKFDRSIGHFRRYTRRGLERTVRAAGFRIRDTRYFDWLGVVPWWLRFKLLGASGLAPGAVRLYDRIGVPIMKITESIIRPPVGKNVILIAEKPRKGRHAGR